MTDTNYITYTVQAANKRDAAMKLLFEHYLEEETKLVHLLYQSGVSQGKIAKALGVSINAVSLRFPKGGKK